MDFLALLRSLAALAIVLGILAGALWAVRRFDITLPGSMMNSLRGSNGNRRLEIVERMPLDARRTIALIRRDNREHLVMIAPEGLLIIEAGIPRSLPRPLPDA